MGRVKQLAIDLDTLTAQDWADARAIMVAGGVDPDALDWDAAQADPTTLPLPALAALIHVVRRREHPRARDATAVRLACEALGVPDVG